MKILALETTEAIGTVAALCDANLLYEHELNPQQRSAQSLAPGLKAALERVGWAPAEVELVAVSVGPGSFTGLRVGVTTAKAFAYSVGAEVMGIDTLEVIAGRAPAEVQTLATAVDAQRGQIIAGLFQRGADGWFETVGTSQLLDAKAWLANLAPGTPVTGPALRKLGGRIPSHVTVLPPELWGPTAASVGQLAAHYYGLGRRGDLWSLSPHYSRPSAAEEKWATRRTV
ncbi:MAG: tRNA (adenosine(37)-N6)-threonylcarbamoyltransferase complex dimerization subunit type 1 TsaB [Thermoguttaceae bacterium]